jgi:uncharacterized protein YbjT (DUF2867 family)
MTEKILVIGATGRIGNELVKLLIKKGKTVRAATRNPEKVISIFKNSVEVTKFDYEQPQTFASSLIGIEKIFLTVRPGDNQSDKFAMPLIDEAKKANVQLIVDLTAMGVEQDETFMLRILERYIEQSGIAYTHLRPNWFMQNFNSGAILADIRATGAFHLPAADATVSFIEVLDIAAIGLAVLTEQHHIGKAYTLTGIEALSYFDVAQKISDASGRKISYAPISEEIARSILTKTDIPKDIIERWTEFYRKIRNGFCSPISTHVELILGRKPILFDNFAKKNSEMWK